MKHTEVIDLCFNTSVGFVLFKMKQVQMSRWL